MNKMKEHISKEEILNLPVTTNRLVVAWNKGAFFAKYAIVSYKMDTRDYVRKNLSYEQLSETLLYQLWVYLQSMNSLAAEILIPDFSYL